MAIGIYIPMIDTRSLDNHHPSRSIQDRIAKEGLARGSAGVDVHLITKTNRAGYPFYSAFIKIKDNWWGEAEDVTHILRMVHSHDGYRLHTSRHGHYWLLRANHRDTEEHAALAREQVAFELDMRPPCSKLVDAARTIDLWYWRILKRRRDNVRIGDFITAWTNLAVELQLPCARGDYRGLRQ